MAISKRKKANQWQYRAALWQDGERLATSKWFDRKRDAQDWLDAQKQKFKICGKKRIKITLNDFFYDVFLPLRKPHTKASSLMDYESAYRTHVAPAFGEQLIDRVSTAKWIEFFTDLICRNVNPISRPRTNRIKAYMSKAYTVAVELEQYGVAKNPFRKIRDFPEKKKRKNSWTEAEALNFLSWCYETNNPRATLYRTLYELGLRIGETIALKADALHDNKILIKRIYCKHTKQIMETTKSGKDRELPVYDDLMAELKNTAAIHGDDFVFLSTSGRPFTYDSIRHFFTKDQLDSGIPYDQLISLHKIRHCYATTYANRNKGDIRILSKRLGHASIKTTEIYVKDDIEALRDESADVRFQKPLSAKIIPFKKEA